MNRWGKRNRLIKGRILKQEIDRDGYRRVTLARKHFGVHKLVAMAFVPNPHKSPIVNHKDGVKHNNIPTNLEWVTVKQNAEHAVRMGIHCNMKKGKRLRAEQVPLILERLAEGESRQQIARDFNIREGHIQKIKSGEIFKTIVREWKKQNGEIANLTWKKKQLMKGTQ
jgi:hypothetical protein